MKRKCPKCKKIAQLIKKNIGDPEDFRRNHQPPRWAYFTKCCNAQTGETKVGYDVSFPKIGF